MTTRPTSATYVLEGTLTADQPLATCSKDLSDREGGSNKPIPVPSMPTEQGTRLYFPASGIRGKLRRAMRDLVRQRVIDITGNPTPFDLPTHYFLTLGGIKSSGEVEKSSVGDHIVARQKNPILNIFGAGDAGLLGFVGGRLSMGNAICVDADKPTVFSGTRTDEFYRDTDQTAYLSDADLLRLTDQSQTNRERSKLRQQLRKANTDFYKARSADESPDVIQKLLGTIETLKANIEQMDTRSKEEGGATNSVGMPLAGWQAIPQGSVMQHRMILRKSDSLNLSFLLNALSTFSLEPLLGAHVASGNGLVSGEWTVYQVTMEGKTPIGKVAIEPFMPLSITEDPKGELSTIMGEFDAFMETKEWDFGIPEVSA